MILAGTATAADVTITLNTLYLIGTVMAGTAATVLFIMRESRQNRKLFYRVISLHNKEDDDRFQELSDEIWKIHLRNASRDGDRPPQRKTLPRRRYLAETIGEDGTELEAQIGG